MTVYSNVFESATRTAYNNTDVYVKGLFAFDICVQFLACQFNCTKAALVKSTLHVKHNTSTLIVARARGQPLQKERLPARAIWL
eukprot:1363309-Amphidinium_carterae.1